MMIEQNDRIFPLSTIIQMEVIESVNSVKRSSAHITRHSIERKQCMSRSNWASKRTSCQHQKSILDEMKISSFMQKDTQDKNKDSVFAPHKHLVSSISTQNQDPSKKQVRQITVTTLLSQQKPQQKKKKHKRTIGFLNNVRKREQDDQYLMSYLKRKIQFSNHYIIHKKNKINDKFVSIYKDGKENIEHRTNKHRYPFSDIPKTQEMKRKERKTQWFSQCEHIGEQNALKIQRFIEGGYREGTDDYTKIFDLTAFQRTKERFRGMASVYSSIRVKAKARDLSAATTPTLFNVVGYLEQSHKMRPEQRQSIQSQLKIAQNDCFKRY